MYYEEKTKSGFVRFIEYMPVLLELFAFNSAYCIRVSKCRPINYVTKGAWQNLFWF